MRCAAGHEGCTREHQPRERAVPCRRCWSATWEIDAVCSSCQAKGRMVNRTTERGGE